MVYDGITRQQILDLIPEACDPAISVYVPTARAGADVMQGRIKLKNLLVQAENLLVDRGMRRTLAIDLLKPVADLDNDPNFWNDRLDAVAFFLRPGWFEAFHLPFSTPEFLHVGDRFYVRPALQTLNQCRLWYVLALDKNHVHLVRCGLRRASEVHVEGMPESMDSFVSVEHGEKRLQFHTAGAAGRAGSIISHGTGDKGVDHKERLNRLALAVARSVEAHLMGSTEPVALAGTEEFQDSFRAVTKLHNLLDRGITRSPKLLEPLDLKAESEAIIRDHADAPRLAALAHYAEMAGTGLTSHQLDEILPAAVQGKIDMLFTRSDAAAWGPFNGGVTVRDEPLVGDQELLNEASLITLQNSGSVYPFQKSELAISEPIAAIFRY
jgi:hypothetical protein